MKKLLNISIKIWSIIGLIVGTTIIAIILILRMKIERTINVHLSVNDQNKISISFNNNAIYHVKKNKKITIKLEGKYIRANIKNILYDKKTNKFIITLINVNDTLMPFTTLDAQLIYGTQSVWNMLVNPGV